MSLRLLLLIAAVLFLVFAAFAWFSNDTVGWLYLGLACWAASFAADDVPVGRRRRPPE